MAESSKSYEVGEYNKLSGLLNYNVWKIKMEAVLRREKLWSLVEKKQNPTALPATIGGVVFPNVEKLDLENQRALSGLILLIWDSLLGIVTGKQDPGDSWDLSRKMYNAEIQPQIVFLTNKLYNISMKDGEELAMYLMEASNLQNHRTALGETISDKLLMNVILNGLPRSYRMII